MKSKRIALILIIALLAVCIFAAAAKSNRTGGPIAAFLQSELNSPGGSPIAQLFKQVKGGASSRPNNAAAADPYYEPIREPETESTPLRTKNTGACAPMDGGEMSVTFLSVGQGDCTIIQSNGHVAIVDGGTPAASSTVYSYLSSHGIRSIDYCVCTHRDSDHVGGLSGAVKCAAVSRAFCSVTEDDGQPFRNWKRALDEQGVPITVPELGVAYQLGDAVIQFVGPVAEYPDPNNNSLVMKVYCGDTVLLITGDMEREAEADLLEAGTDLQDVTVLRVGHHGSRTSTSYRFLYETMPEYAVISCGAGNEYGHPHEEVLSRLRDAEVSVFRTDLQGTVTLMVNGSEATWSTEKSATPEELNPTIARTPEFFIGNTRSLAVHSPACEYLPAEHNRCTFSTLADAIAAGYSPCKNCLP